MDAPLDNPPLGASLPAASSFANPARPGPGVAPGNVDRTAPQSDPGSIGGGTAPRPERYLIVARYADEVVGAESPSPRAEAPRYLFARWADWPFPAMLALAPPARDETLADAIGRVLWAR
ncbi:MAG: hypothetical protein O2843_12525, partial [Chloroflexi bacterium]|nr:hypothetical protein [Chloroflexota bacterium]